MEASLDCVGSIVFFGGVVGTKIGRSIFRVIHEASEATGGKLGIAAVAENPLNQRGWRALLGQDESGDSAAQPSGDVGVGFSLSVGLTIKLADLFRAASDGRRIGPPLSVNVCSVGLMPNRTKH
jgi:hypothetical protein